MYIILETQTNTDGSLGTLINQYEDRNAAESKYHQVLSSAAISELPHHCAFMLSDEGFVIKSECYTHEVTSNEE